MSQESGIGALVTDDVYSDESLTQESVSNINTVAESVSMLSTKKSSKKTFVKSGVKTESNKCKGEVLQKKHAYMYLGPNIPGGVLFTGSVYKEIPKHLKDIFVKIPEIKDLFVEIKDVPTFKQALGHKGSEPARKYQNVKALIGEGVLKGAGI